MAASLAKPFSDMKVIFSIIISMLLVIQVYAQNDSSLSGSWKLVALSNPEMYYDLNKDSFSISKGVEKEMGSVEKQKQFKQYLYSSFNGAIYHFERHGLFKYMVKDKIIAEGSYQRLPKKNAIRFKTKNEKGKLDVTEIAIEIKDNQLRLLTASEKLFDFLLEKN